MGTNDVGSVEPACVVVKYKAAVAMAVLLMNISGMKAFSVFSFSFRIVWKLVLCVQRWFDPDPFAGEVRSLLQETACFDNIRKFAVNSTNV
jgi:hypothetical protein